MGSRRSSVDSATLKAWRGLLAATGKRLGLRTYLLQYCQELLPRFAALIGNCGHCRGDCAKPCSGAGECHWLVQRCC